MALVVPMEEFCLLSSEELEGKICGSPDISMEALRQVVTCNLEADHAKTFWEVMEHDLSGRDRSDFLRFACGYRRLPPDPTQFRQRVTVSSRGGGDDRFPTAGTCSGSFQTPRYSSRRRMAERFLAAFAYGGAEIDALRAAPLFNSMCCCLGRCGLTSGRTPQGLSGWMQALSLPQAVYPERQLCELYYVCVLYTHCEAA